jgi:chemotaxis protein CheX
MITHEKIVQGIQAAAIEVCGVMLGEDARPGPARLETMGAEQADGLVALVGMTGPLVGTGSVSCDARLACRLAGAMWCAQISAVDEEVLDALGEIANMIVGNIKASIEEQAGPMWLSVPTVVYGKNFITYGVSKQPCTMVPFLCGDSQLVVRVSLAEAGDIPKLTRRPLAVLRGLEPTGAPPYNG